MADAGSDYDAARYLAKTLTALGYLISLARLGAAARSTHHARGGTHAQLGDDSMIAGTLQGESEPSLSVGVGS